VQINFRQLSPLCWIPSPLCNSFPSREFPFDQLASYTPAAYLLIFELKCPRGDIRPRGALPLSSFFCHPLSILFSPYLRVRQIPPGSRKFQKLLVRQSGGQLYCSLPLAYLFPPEFGLEQASSVGFLNLDCSPSEEIIALRKLPTHART